MTSGRAPHPTRPAERQPGSGAALPVEPGTGEGHRRWAPAVPVVGTAVVVLLVAAAATGALASPVAPFPDPGLVVRLGLPVLRVVQDLAAAVTVGLLVVAALLVPERPSSRPRRVATRAAAAAAAAWCLTGVLGVVLSFADISAVDLVDPSFVAILLQSVGPIEVLRVAVVSAGLAGVVAVGAAFARGRTAVAWLAALAVFALLPAALGGHAAGSADHEAAVDSLAAHLVGSAVWLGGLLALVMLRPLLGAALRVTVQRYSVLAGWCFAVVAASGLLNASLRLGGWSGLGSAYGVVVLLKGTALVALGIAGWRQRRVVLPRLEDPDARGRPFARLALTELVVMAAAFGLAAALSRSVPPAPDVTDVVPSAALALTGYPPPAGPLTSSGWFTVWRVAWLWACVACVLVGLYLAAVVRLRRRGDSWPMWRSVVWVVGWAVMVWATCGAPSVYGRVQMSMHMVMHMVVSMVVPIFLVLAAPVTLGLRTLPRRGDGSLGPRELLLASVHSRALSVLANPVVAAVLFFGSLVVFYFTGLFELALTTHTGHVLMTLHFLLAGYLFAWVLVGEDPGPRRWAPSLRLLVLFATISFHAFFGVVLTSQTTLLAGDFYRLLALPWVDVLADQRTAGAVAWGVGEMPTLVLAILVTVAWVRADGAETRRRDRQADRDDDAELRAYNAVLAARTDRGRGQ